MVCQVIGFIFLLNPALTLRRVKSHIQHPKELVILRTYNPHEDMVHRMNLYSADIKKNMPDARFLISVDNEFYQAGLIEANVPEAAIHIYESNAVTNAYRKSWSEPWNLDGTPVQPNAWNAHTEPLNLAAKYAVHHFNMTFDYIWMMDDDVVLCGPISQLMTEYQSNDADLLGDPLGPATFDWPHLDEGTPNFLRKYPPSVRQHGNEWVVRFSQSFLNHLHDLSYAQGVSAQSEMFPYTVAFAENYKRSQWKPEHKGEACWNCVITKPHARSMCQQVEQRGGVSINHAGKFEKDFGWKGMLDFDVKTNSSAKVVTYGDEAPKKVHL